LEPTGQIVTTPRWIHDRPKSGHAQLDFVSRAVASKLLDAGRGAQLSGTAAHDALKAAFRLTLAAAAAELRGVTHAGLPALIALHEVLMTERPTTRSGMPVDASPLTTSERVERTNATRWLVEAACHICPGGRRPLSFARWSRLAAWVQTAQRVGLLSDTAWKNQGKVDVRLSRRDGLQVATAGGYPDASVRVALQAGGQATLDYLREAELRVVVETCPNELRASSQALEGAVGFPVSALGELRQQHGDAEPGEVRRSSAAELRRLVATAGLRGEPAAAFLGRFGLVPDASFDPVNAAYQPHRTGRSSAYGRRAFIGSDDGYFYWAPSHLVLVESDFMRRLVTNRLGWGTNASRACAPLSQCLDEEFNRRFYRAAKKLGTWKVLANATRVGGRDVAGVSGTLGDIDVLAIHKVRPLVIAIETKRIDPGLGAYEVWREADRFFNDKGYASKHLARAEWLHANRDALDAEAGRECDWDVRPVIATTSPLMSAGRDRMHVPVLAYWDVLAYLQDPDELASGGFGVRQLAATQAWTEL
jgi:hypothetical protein